MDTNLNLQNYLVSVKNDGPKAVSNMQAKNFAPENTPVQKPDEFVSSKNSTLQKSAETAPIEPDTKKIPDKKKFLLYILGLAGAAMFGAASHALIAKHFSKHTSDVKTTTDKIKRFKQIDKTVYRGAKPTEEQYKILKDSGINTVIALNRDPAIKAGKKLEKDVAKANGINFVPLPMDYKKLPSDKDVKTFFKTIEKAKKNKEKIYIHCTYGKDRTGLYSAMYQIKYGLSDTKNAIYEMISMNHDYKKHPQMIEYLEEGKFLKL